MPKILVVLRCCQAAGAVDFGTWWHKRGAVVAAMPGVRRYVQDMVTVPVRRAQSSDTFGRVGGFEEIWIDASAPLATVQGLASAGDQDLGHAPAHIPQAQVLVVREQVVFARLPDASGLQKRISLLVRRQGLTPEQFSDYWQRVHAPLAACHRFVERYVQNHVLPSSPHRTSACEAHAVDGIAEFLISNVERMQEDYDSPVGTVMKADVPNFADTVDTYYVASRDWPISSDAAG